MSPVDATQHVGSTAYIAAETGAAAPKTTQSDPLPASRGHTAGAVASDLPTLSPPMPSSLALSSLLDALNFTVQDATKESSEVSMESKAEAIAKNNDNKLEELGKQIGMLQADGVLGIFQQIFSAIAAVLSIVAGALLTAFAGPVGVAVLVPAIMGAVNAITSAASGGEMSSAMSGILQAAGVPQETAQIVGGVSSAVVGLAGAVAGLVLTGGTSTAAKVMGKVAEKGSKLLNIGTKVNTMVSSSVEILNGACGMADSGLGYAVGTSKSKVKDMEATLEHLNQSLQADQEFLKSVMERTQDLLNKVMDVVKSCDDARKAVLMVSPAMA